MFHCTVATGPRSISPVKCTLPATGLCLAYETTELEPPLMILIELFAWYLARLLEVSI